MLMVAKRVARPCGQNPSKRRVRAKDTLEIQMANELGALFAGCFQQSISLVDAIGWTVEFIYPRYSMERVAHEIGQIIGTLDTGVHPRAKRDLLLQRLSAAQQTFDRGIQSAKDEILRLLADEGLVGFGIKAPITPDSEHEPIPAVYWKALVIDWERGCAAEGTLVYFDIRVARLGLVLLDELDEMPVQTMTIGDDGIATFRDCTDDERGEPAERTDDWRNWPMWRVPDVTRQPEQPPAPNPLATADETPGREQAKVRAVLPQGAAAKHRSARTGMPGRPQARWDLVLPLVIARLERAQQGVSMAVLIDEIREQLLAQHPEAHIPAATTIRDHWPRLMAEARQVQRNP
jgi:hypothetical protein